MNDSLSGALRSIEGRLVVSVQASQGDPLRDSAIITALAMAALKGGAAGLRINGPEDIEPIRSLSDVPIIGLHKVYNGRRNVITPNLALAAGLAKAGADVLALDATEEVLGTDYSYLSRAQEVVGRPVMADISTLEEGLRAWDEGVAAVGTTLSGYTPQSQGDSTEPDLDLVASLAEAGIRVIAEGRYRTPSQVVAAFEAGAFAVVVGGAITDPAAITARFVQATPRIGPLPR
jgi:N-acylglucosamine-6-phosphate 2-epimerase